MCSHTTTFRRLSLPGSLGLRASSARPVPKPEAADRTAGSARLRNAARAGGGRRLRSRSPVGGRSPAEPGGTSARPGPLPRHAARARRPPPAPGPPPTVRAEPRNSGAAAGARRRRGHDGARGSARARPALRRQHRRRPRAGEWGPGPRAAAKSRLGAGPTAEWQMAGAVGFAAPAAARRAAPRRPRTGGAGSRNGAARRALGPRRGRHVAGGGPAGEPGGRRAAEEEDGRPGAAPAEQPRGPRRGRPGAGSAQVDPRPPEGRTRREPAARGPHRDAPHRSPKDDRCWPPRHRPSFPTSSSRSVDIMAAECDRAGWARPRPKHFAGK